MSLVCTNLDWIHIHLHAVEEIVTLGLLVDDGVDADGRLTRLTVPDDQLTLPTADRDERVYGLQAGLFWT